MGVVYVACGVAWRRGMRTVEFDPRCAKDISILSVESPEEVVSAEEDCVFLLNSEDTGN